ncbi:MAG: (Fe-S)-binding protein, partial [Chloroflexota bacterium]
MLSITERIAFLIIIGVFGTWTLLGFRVIFNLVRSGRAAPPLKNLVSSITKALIDVGMQKTIFRSRPILSFFHAFIFFGFSYYLIVNGTDVLEGFVPGFELIYNGELLAQTYPALQGLVDSGVINFYNLAADILSVGVLVGMITFLVRRFIVGDKRQEFNKDVLLLDNVKKGSVFRDSLIVGIWMLTHIGARFMGQILRLAREGKPDPYMPFASFIANAFSGASASGLELGIHISWWLAIGSV